MKQIRMGAMLSYVSIFLTFFMGLIYTPVLIRWLGQTDYGIYSLVISLVAYLSLLDMGIGNAIVRYISRNRAMVTKNKESDLIGQFLMFFTIIGLITLIIGFILLLNVHKIFGNSLDGDQIKTAQVMILVLTINFAFSFPLNVFSAVLKAYEQFVFLKLSSILRSVLVPVLTIITLYLGGHLIAMTVITTSVNLTILLIAFLFCKIKFNIKTTFSPIEKSMKKEIIIYSSLIFITSIADRIYWQTDQVMLGIMRNPETVAIYAVAIQLTMIFGSLSTAISGLFLPMISRLVTKVEHMKELNSLFISVSRIQCYILALAFSGFILFGKEFISLWAGKSYIQSYWIVIILMIPFFFDLISNIGLSILQAKGLNLFRAVSLLSCSILNIVISIPIIDEYGSLGTAVITSIFIAIGNVILLNFYYRYKVKLDIRSYWVNIIGILTPVIILSIIFYFSFESIIHINLNIIFKIITYILVYVLIVILFILNKKEKQSIKEFVLIFKNKKFI